MEHWLIFFFSENVFLFNEFFTTHINITTLTKARKIEINYYCKMASKLWWKNKKKYFGKKENYFEQQDIKNNHKKTLVAFIIKKVP